MFLVRTLYSHSTYENIYWIFHALKSGGSSNTPPGHFILRNLESSACADDASGSSGFVIWTGLFNLIKPRVTLTIKTSNSSRHLKGDSMVPHKAVRKEIVDTDLSPPDSDFMTDVLSSTPFSEYSSFGPLWTFTCGGPKERWKSKTYAIWNADEISLEHKPKLRTSGLVVIEARSKLH